jgi:hypothetical protein
MTDWFSLCEQAVHAKLADLERVAQSPKQMSYGDDSIFAKGFTYFVRSKPGTYASSKVSASQIEYIWHITLEVYVKFATNLENTWLEFRAFRADVDNAIQHDDTLNKTIGVQQTAVDAPVEPQYVQFDKDDAGAPIFIMQTLDVQVLQKVPRDRS